MTKQHQTVTQCQMYMTLQRILMVARIFLDSMSKVLWAVMLSQAGQYKTAFATHIMLLKWLVGAVFFARVIQQIYVDI